MPDTTTEDLIFVTNPDTNTAGFQPLTPGLTAGQLFERNMQGKNTADYMIRVGAPGASRDVVGPDRVLNANEAISFTPTKIQGA